MKHPNNAIRRLCVALCAVMLVTATLALSPAPAHAEDDDHVPGELLIRTKFQFAKFTVDGRSTWENHTYIEKQKTLHIFGLARGSDHTVTVVPREEGYEPIELKIAADKFKRKRVRRDGARILVFQQVFRLKFKKVAKAKEPAKGDRKAPRKKPPVKQK